MAKQAMILELITSDVVWLAWAAGVAVGQENEDAANSLNAMLQRIQFVTLPDEGDAPATDTWEDDGGTPQNEDDEAHREVDPRFSAAAAPPAPPMNRQDDFGAGPPPGV